MGAVSSTPILQHRAAHDGEIAARVGDFILCAGEIIPIGNDQVGELALIAGTGLDILPDFILREALATRRLEKSLPDWSLASGAVYW